VREGHQSGMIRFSQPAAFNDPFELRPALRTVISERGAEEQFERHSKKHPEIQPLRSPILAEMKHLSERGTPVMHAHLVKGLNESLGILSLTRQPDSLCMWAHYANAHQGFVIEFDERHPWFQKGYEGDAAHGFAHRDVYETATRTRKEAMGMSLRDALTYADRDIDDGWSEYVDAFRRRTRK
jgi:hypothetical protein